MEIREEIAKYIANNDEGSPYRQAGSIISLIVERIKGIENPYHYEHTGCDAFIMSGSFNSAIQKAVELFEVKK